MNSIFRLDRFLTLYFFYPLMKMKPKSNEIRIPILMYHSISQPDKKQKHPYYETCTSPKVFAEHMKFLEENNYKVISLDQAVKILKSYQPEQQLKTKHSKLKITTIPNQPQKYVVLTFDDGFKDFYTDAFPILQKYNFQATVFLPTAFIGKHRKKFKGKECLVWKEVFELSEKGIEFGSHTVNHNILKRLRIFEIEFEIKRSKEDIENGIGDSVNSFSYPYAFPEHDITFNQILSNLLKNNGIKCGVTTTIGTNNKKDNLLFLKRIPLNILDDVFFLKVKLEGGYNWLNKIQFFYKKTKTKMKKSALKS